MEKLKLQSSCYPKDRPSQNEWVKEFKFGTNSKPKYEAINEKALDIMGQYDFSKLKKK